MSSTGREERRSDTIGQLRAPEFMNISVVPTTATTPNKDHTIARPAEKEPEAIKVVFCRLPKHKCVDPQGRLNQNFELVVYLGLNTREDRGTYSLFKAILSCY
jgi:hypothetical protein